MSAPDGVTPTVSVCMITYNHERFIAQAIESVLMQETDFPVELVIGEDCSTDGTRAIVVEYAQRYPERIRPFLRERNLGMIPNFVATLQACRGKYIALLEGDDYWTDPHKLQKQVQFLEGHPDYVLCHHDAMIVDEHGYVLQDSKLPAETKRDFSQEELMAGAWILTLTACFRNVIQEFPPEFLRVFNGDSFLFSMLGQFGRSKYLGDCIKPAAYRQHPGGVWSPIDHQQSTFYLAATFYWLSKYYRRIAKKRHAEYFEVASLTAIDEILWKIICSGSLKQCARILKKFTNITEEAKIGRFVLKLVTAPISKRSNMHMRIVFADYKTKNRATTLYHLMLGVLFNPCWLRNRSVWSIAVQVCLGRKAGIFLRQILMKALRFW
jgi:glycosyltransferase involved in cell wall biosynthesis